MNPGPHPLRRLVAGSLLALLALSLWGTAPASADASVTIDHVMPAKGAVRLLVSVPGADAVDTEGVTVTIDGQDVESSATAASNSSLERTSVLAIDTSASMAGTRIIEAKKAALAYLAAVPTNVKVGVLRCTTGSWVLSPRPAPVARRPGSARSCSSPTARTPPGRP